MSDLISRSALLDWINEQKEEVTKKQVAGTDGSIFTRETLVTMQRCLSTFETAINNQPIAYDVDAVVEQLAKKQEIYVCSNDDYEEGKYNAYGEAIKIVLNGGKEQK